MNLSYWEYASWFAETDFTVVGSGIVGLNCALHLRKRFPGSRILVLERGVLPLGASTRNAGFACFGSLSELLADLEQHSTEEVVQLVRQRWEGIQLLRKLLGDKAIDFQRHGGHEVFLEHQQQLYEECLVKMETLNRLLSPVFGTHAFQKQANTFQFKKVQDYYITHIHEGQLDTGKMMEALLNKVRKEGIHVLNGLDVKRYEEMGSRVCISTDHFEFYTRHLLIATNGFARELVKEEVQPARAQVLVTAPIPNLAVQGTFHMDRGYYYFRNIHNRLLIGGGRNLDMEGETTMEFGETEQIQSRLEELVREVILPGTPVAIERRWSGIMGVGGTKKPIVRQLSDRVFCGVRLGGMGIAIGSLVGRELADLLP